MFGKHIKELPDYNIQQVEQSEYQNLDFFGNIDLIKNRKLIIITLIALIFAIYYQKQK